MPVEEVLQHLAWVKEFLEHLTQLVVLVEVPGGVLIQEVLVLEAAQADQEAWDLLQPVLVEHLLVIQTVRMEPQLLLESNNLSKVARQEILSWVEAEAEAIPPN